MDSPQRMGEGCDEPTDRIEVGSKRRKARPPKRAGLDDGARSSTPCNPGSHPHLGYEPRFIRPV
jgi:hypothetical protein